MEKVSHVGDLGHSLENSPGEECIDQSTPALDAGDCHPPQGNAPRQSGEHLVHTGLKRAPWGEV